MSGLGTAIARENYKEGRTDEILSMVEDNDITLERGAERLDISVENLKKLMEEKGYDFPETMMV